MKRRVLISLFCLAGAPNARATPPSLDAAEAVRLVEASGTSLHTTSTTWNGTPTMFVDFLVGPDRDAERQVWAVQQTDRRLHKIKVTTGEQNGGDATVAAIAFANADRDAPMELIVILSWPVKHLDVEGTFYTAELFDDAKPGQANLTALSRLNRLFGSGCDCARSDGTRDRYAFKTVAAIRRELSRLGYQRRP